MVVLPDINNIKDIEAWLRGRSSEDCAIIAQRATMRVVPLLWAAMPPAQKQAPSAAPILRKHLALDVARRYRRGSSDYEMFAELDAITDEAAFLAFADYGSNSDGEKLELADAFNSGDPSSFAARIVHRAALAPLFAGDPVESMWNAVQNDVHVLTQGSDALALPLWPFPNPLELDWQKAQAILRKMPGGDFWLNWYQRLLDGEPQNWDLLYDVVLIDDAFWDEGSEALAARIGELRDQHALAATFNGERIERNPETGRLRLVPDTPLPEDVAVRVRRKIIKAVDIFDGHSAQIYGALAPDLAMLRRAVADAGNLPVELFDTCASAIHRLGVRIKNEECPSAERDALIGDYRKHLRDAGADILGSDTETQKVLERRAAVTGNDALVEAEKEILEAVDAFAPLLEEPLAEALQQDAAIATCAEASPELRAVPSFRFSGRLLRIGKEIGKGLAAGTGATISIGSYLQAVEAIYRYFGL